MGGESLSLVRATDTLGFGLGRATVLLVEDGEVEVVEMVEQAVLPVLEGVCRKIFDEFEKIVLVELQLLVGEVREIEIECNCSEI